MSLGDKCVETLDVYCAGRVRGRAIVAQDRDAMAWWRARYMRCPYSANLNMRDELRYWSGALLDAESAEEQARANTLDSVQRLLDMLADAWDPGRAPIKLAQAYLKDASGLADELRRLRRR